MSKFNDFVIMMGGAERIKECLQHGNDAPLQLTIDIAKEEIDMLRGVIKGIRDYCKGNEEACCHITENTIDTLKEYGLWD